MVALNQLKGWRIAVGDFHMDIVKQMPEEASLAMTRAYYRIYSLTSYDQLENVAFAWQLATDGVTGVMNIPKGKERTRIDDVILGVFAALEIQFEGRFESGDVKA